MPTSTPRVASVSNISWRFNSPPTTVTFTIATDIIGKLSVAILPPDAGAVAVTVTEASSAIGQRNVAVTLPANSVGKSFRFSILLVPDDTTLRSYPTDGGFRVPESRTVARGNALPVRFHSFSGPGTAAVPAPGVNGNWSTYTWAQWNPKGT